MKSTYLLSACAALALATQATAQDRILYWNGSTDVNWSTTANWDELSTDGTLSAAATAPVSGDIVVLVAATSNDPTNLDIPSLVLDGIWFGPSAAADGYAVGSSNASTLGINSGGQGFAGGADIAGTLRARFDVTSGVTTASVTNTMFNDTLPENAGFLHAVAVGTVLDRGPLDGLTVTAVDPAAGTITLSAPPGSSGSNQETDFPSFIDIDVPVELHGAADSDVVILITGDEGTVNIDAFFTTDPAGTVVGLFRQGGNNVGFNGGGQGDVILTNANNDFLGRIAMQATNADFGFTSLAAAGQPSAAGAGSTLNQFGGGGSRLEYSGPSVSTDRTIIMSNEFEQVNSDATVDWTGNIELGSGGGNRTLEVFGTWNQIGDIVMGGTRNLNINAGNSAATVNLLNPTYSITDSATVTVTGGGRVNVAVLNNQGQPSSLGEGTSVSVNGNLVYFGTADTSTDRNIGTAGNANASVRNNSGFNLELNNAFVHGRSNPTASPRGMTINNESGSTTFGGTFVAPNGGASLLTFFGNPITVTGPSGALDDTNIGSGSGASGDQIEESFVTVTAAAAPDATATVQVDFNGDGSTGNATIEVDDTTGITPGMLAVLDGVLSITTVVVSVDSSTEVTLSENPDGVLAASSVITFKGLQPLGYGELSLKQGTLVLNTTATNSGRIGSDIAFSMGAGGATEQRLTGNGTIAPLLPDQTVATGFGFKALAPGNSIGTFTFGSSGVPLGTFEFGDVDFEMEISGDQTDKVDVWVDEITGTFESLAAADIILTNIGSTPPATGDFTIIESRSGAFIGNGLGGAPINLQLVGNFSGRTVTITTDDPEFGFDVTQIILSIEFTADATNIFDDFVAAFPGVTPDVTSDDDGDGATLLEEFLANTSPLDASDVPGITFEIVDVATVEFPAIRFTRPTDDTVATAVGEVDDDLSTGPDFQGPPSTVLESVGTPFIGNGGVEYVEVLYRSDVSITADDDQFLRVNGSVILPD